MYTGSDRNLSVKGGILADSLACGSLKATSAGDWRQATAASPLMSE